MNLLPAVALGGPPHRGKSVLAYSLTHALRERGVQHYVLRAAPDGEGDWANEADQQLVRTIRYKRAFSVDFVRHVTRSLTSRHLPLIVDAGGRPTRKQEALFDHCTHAILLYQEESELQNWRSLVERHNLITLAELLSDLEGPDEILDAGPVLKARIGGLIRGTRSAGVVVERLVQRLSGVFAYSPDELLNLHRRRAPVEPVVLEHLAATMSVQRQGDRFEWQPEHIAPALESAVAGAPAAVYGRGPNWLYSAFAAHALPSTFWQFDVRLGWVSSPEFEKGRAKDDSPLLVDVQQQDGYVVLDFHLPFAYLDYTEAAHLNVPDIPSGLGMVLSGKLPNWMFTGLVQTYAEAAWLAVYYPQLKSGIVVARHSANTPSIGTTIPMTVVRARDE
jgi:CRISPR-associated protein Csx3